ncbi:MAG: hypothetical protein MUC96_16355 [Myxococcaceae bacterium]|jgi:hypothetical protein|nr:hypothetical protein [Myxococcaceae bacterium]
MPLSEAQVQRYSRQILLKEVGGRGQLRLLAAPFEVAGASSALDVAVAYLAASGTPLRSPFEHHGFVAGVALPQFSPDVEVMGPVAGWLGPLEALGTAPTELHRVGLGPGVVVAARALAVSPREVVPGDDVDPVSVGALAALMAQRLVLALERAEVVTARFSGGRWVREA